MYCRHCGKELPNDSNFCPNCGKKQKQKDTLNSFGENKLIEIIKSNKVIAYSYSVWFLVNLALFIFAKPNGRYDTDDFYPFSSSLGEIFEGSDFYVNILGVNRYDFSEFFLVLLDLV